jgi:protein-arginine kinase activator protein McsA
MPNAKGSKYKQHKLCNSCHRIFGRKYHGKVLKHLALGKCNSCYQYFRREKKEIWRKSKKA